MKNEFASAPPCPVVGYLKPTLRRLHDELREFVYVFSGFDRILGLYGSIEQTPCGDIVLRQFLVCCTQRQRTPRDTERGFIAKGLREAGWERVHADACQEHWRNGDYGITLLSGPNLGNEGSFHVALHFGEGLAYMDQHVERSVPRHHEKLDLANAATPSSFEAKSVSLNEVLAHLAGRRLAVYTGAGISIASGIPSFSGPGSLDVCFPLQEPFPGDVVAWMIATPDKLTHEIGSFQARLASAEPNAAHRALAELGTYGKITRIVTTNLDMLHERAGSSIVQRPGEFLESVADNDERDIDALLVIGVSDDADGVVAWARSVKLPVVVADVRAPVYLRWTDCHLQADAETILLALVRRERSKQAMQCPIFPFDSSPMLRTTGEVRHRVPAFQRLLDELSRRSTSIGSEIHGNRHWQETALIGLALLADVPRADPTVVLLFAILHDCQRMHDGHDPQHGTRAVRLIEELCGDYIDLCDARRIHLTAACAAHSDGYVTLDPTIGACWDADRLGLWRIGVEPHGSALSLAESRVTSRIEWARHVQELPLEWSKLYEEYAIL